MADPLSTGLSIASIAIPALTNLFSGNEAAKQASKQQNNALTIAREQQAAEQARFEEIMELFLQDRQFADDLFARFDQPKGGEFGETIAGTTFLGPLMAALSARPSISPNQGLGVGNNTGALLNAQFAQDSRAGANSAYKAFFNSLFGTGSNNGVFDLLEQMRQNNLNQAAIDERIPTELPSAPLTSAESYLGDSFFDLPDIELITPEGG